MTASARREGAPAYDLLYRRFRSDILSGRRRAGEKLPSKRAAAREEGVCVATVENAYAQLEAEGYIRGEQRRGYFVLPVLEQSAPPEKAAPRRTAAPVERKELLLDFRSGYVDPGKFPFSVWARLMRQVISEEDKALLRPCPNGGALPLRAALSDYLYRARGMAAEPEQIVVGAGTEYLYTLLVQLLGRDEVYGVEDPGYGQVRRIYAANGARVRCLPVDGAGLCCPGPGEEARVLHLSPAHHFPTGVVMPVGRRQELLRWAGEEEGRFLIEDDYDSEFRLSGRPIPTLSSMDEGGKVLYVNTFSKTLSPALRISYMVLPLPLLEQYRERLGFYACTVSGLEQHTLAKFIADGYFERHIGRMKTFYRAKRDAVAAAVAESPLGARSRILEADAGLHFLLELDTDLEDGELERRAAAAGVGLRCLSGYVHGDHPAQKHRVVVNYAGLELERLPEALRRLCALM